MRFFEKSRFVVVFPIFQYFMYRWTFGIAALAWAFVVWSVALGSSPTSPLPVLSPCQSFLLLVTWLGWVVFPEIRVYLELVNVLSFGKRVFADVIKLRLSWIRGRPISNMTDVHIRRGKVGLRHTDRTAREGNGRDRSAASTSQGVPKTADNHQRLKERHGTDFPLQPSERAWPCWQADFILPASRAVRE